MPGRRTLLVLVPPRSNQQQVPLPAGLRKWAAEFCFQIFKSCSTNFDRRVQQPIPFDATVVETVGRAREKPKKTREVQVLGRWRGSPGHHRRWRYSSVFTNLQFSSVQFSSQIFPGPVQSSESHSASLSSGYSAPFRAGEFHFQVCTALYSLSGEIPTHARRPRRDQILHRPDTRHHGRRRESSRAGAAGLRVDQRFRRGCERRFERRIDSVNQFDTVLDWGDFHFLSCPHNGWVRGR